MKKIRFEDMSRYNRIAVLNLIRQSEGISRALIVKQTGFSGPSVSAIVSDLIRNGLVSETGMGESSVGKKPILLTFEANAGTVLAFDVRPDYFEAALFNLNGERKKKRFAGYKESNPIEEKMAKVIECGKKLIDGEKRKENIIGIGLAIPGVIDHINNRLHHSIPMNVHDVDIGRFFSGFNLPLRINNISHCEALAEKWFGKGKNKSDFIFLYVGKGVGAGIISNGRLFNQSRYSTMEIGHNTLDINGDLCRCGKRGCLETYSALWAIKKKYCRRTGMEFISDEQMLEKIAGRDKDAEPILAEAISVLGIELSNLANIFNPETIIISGWLSLIETEILNNITGMVKQMTTKGLADNITIEVSHLGQKAALIGAATLVLEDFFFPRSLDPEADSLTKTKTENLVLQKTKKVKNAYNNN
jgi:predicted NBD/HSP70 family sugar kinase